MDDQVKKEKILNFVKSEIIGVVSTVSKKGLPEAASMAISQTDELKFIFQTPNSSRKYENLKANPNVALVFGFSVDTFITVQVEGVASEVDDNERERISKIHVAKNPKSEKYANLPQNKYFLVVPSWIRYWDFKTGEKFEITI